MSKNPFKFLDSYTKEDLDIFFGRDREIEAMYQKVFESKILLVYGISGTGKTSIINCGLANKFEDSDWLPISIRRGTNINDSLNQGIAKLSLTPVRKKQTIDQQLQSLYLDHFKPIYIIVDQFEELFIFGDKEEREEFIQTVKRIVETEVQCRFIFTIREEYLAGVTEFENTIPDFLSNRMRIEKMTWTNAKKVIEEPCRAYNIEVEEGLTDIILGKLSPESSDVELTYLQVLLDRLFRIAVKKSEENPAFSKELFTQIGDVSDLLGSFLEEQISQLDDPDSGLVILKSFVSIKGTKRQVTLADVSDFTTTLGKKISEEELKNLIIKFVNLRILRDKDESGRYELRHDSLATKIYEKITLVEKELLEVRQFIDSAYSNFEKRKKLLGVDDLEYIAPYENKLFLNRQLERFIENSKKEIQKTKRRRRNVVVAASISLFIIMAGFSIWALNERSKAIQEKRRAQANNFNFRAKEVAVNDPTIALCLAEHALSLDTTNEQIKNNLRRIYYDNSFYKIVGYHDNVIYSVAFSPDGKTILTGSLDITARLWDLQGNELQVFKGHEFGITSVAFSPDGKFILTGSYDNTARLWDLEGNELQVFKGHEYRINSVAFSPDGKTILTGSSDKTARLWDLEGNQLHLFTGHESGVSSVAFSPNGKTILTGSWDKTARLWDLEGNELQVFKGHEEGINSVTFSPDGKTILTGSNDRTARLWDLEVNELQVFNGFENGVTSIVGFSPDCKNILTFSGDNVYRLWDFSGEILQVFRGQISGLSNGMGAFSRNGKKILTIDDSDNTIKLWDLSVNRKQFFKEKHDITTTAYAPNGKTILISCLDQKTYLYDSSGNLLKTLNEQENIISLAIFSPDCKYFITVSIDNNLCLWDLEGNLLKIFKDYENIIRSVTFSPDSKTILTGSDNGIAHLWDLEGNLVQNFNGGNWGRIISLAFSKDGFNILTGSSSGAVQLWDLKGRELQLFKGHEYPVDYVDFYFDSTKVFTASTVYYFFAEAGYAIKSFPGNTIRVWDRLGKQLQINDYDILMTSIALSKDKKYMLNSFTDNTIKNWDVSGNLLQVFKGHKTDIESLSFAADENTFLSSSSNTAILWRIKIPLEEFQKNDKYEKLHIIDKIKYGILVYKDVYKLKNEDELYEAANYYFETSGNLVKDKKIEYLNNALNLYNKLILKQKEAKYFTGLLNVYLALYNIEPGNEKSIIRIGEIYNELITINDYNELLESADYFYSYFTQNKEISLKLKFHDKALQLYNKILNVNEVDKQTKSEIARNCSGFSWLLLEEKEFENALKAALIAKEADRSYLLTYTNLALSYLFNDQFEKAKEVYLEWKDKPFNVEFETFKDVFLVDIKDLEGMGITHPDFEKVKALLEK